MLGTGSRSGAWDQGSRAYRADATTPGRGGILAWMATPAEPTPPPARESPVPDAVPVPRAPVPPPGTAPAATRPAAVRRLATVPARAGRATVRAGASGTRRLRAWSTTPTGGFVVPVLALGVLLLVIAAGAGWAVPALHGTRIAGAPGPSGSPGPVPGRSAGPAPSSGLPGSAAPPQPGQPATPSTGTSTGTTRPVDTLGPWAARLAPVTGIPAAALQAYGYATLLVGATTPACHLEWTTLAGIGKVESDHGASGGSVLQASGMVLPPVIGPALDGRGGHLLVRDTDAGRLDGDATYDHAVGPMQFLPATWQQYQVDADGDGTSDINDLNDAALAAATYLCAAGRDLAKQAGWWAAVLSYNDLASYAQDVFTAADRYGARSLGVT